MKKVILLALVLGVGHQVKADPLNVVKTTNLMHYNHIQGLTAGYQNIGLHDNERIVAQTVIDHIDNLGIDDSVTYGYTLANTNTSAFNYTTLAYPVPSYFTDQGFENLYGRHTTPFVWADTLVQYGRALGPFGLIGEYNFSYANANITQMSYSQVVAPFGNNYSEMSYDKNNNLQNVTGWGWINNTFDSNTRHTFTYRNGQLVADSMYANTYFGVGVSFRLEETNAYTYDNAGDLLTQTNMIFYPNATPPTYNFRYVNTYTADNKLRTSEYDSYSGGHFQVKEVDSFGYTAGVNFCTYWKEIAANSTIPFTIQYHTTSLGIVDSVYGSVDTGGMAPANFKMIFRYDSDNQPVNGKFYYGAGNSFSATPAWEFRYYYEAFTPSKVETITGAADIQVYPNPTTNAVNVTGLNGPATISVINMTGKVVMRQSASGNGVQHISLGGMAAGAYLIHIADAKGRGIYTQPIVKR